MTTKSVLVQLGASGKNRGFARVLNDEADRPRPIYRKQAFDADIIERYVRWYITHRLSYRYLVEMLAERGIEVAHTTILR